MRKLEYTTDILFYQSSKNHWKLIKNFEIGHTNRLSSNSKIKHEGVTLQNNQNIAEEFGESLAKTFSFPTTISKSFEQTVPLTTDQIELSYEEFTKPLEDCNLDAAPGIDKINNKTLKNCPVETLIYIFNIFEASLKLGYIPKQWKCSKITMIHKKGKPPNELQSYRPISLINCISKWLEKIVNNKLMNWAEQSNIFPPTQSGFRKNKSCHDQILRLNQSIINGFNKKMRTGAIFFDLEKAFDKASHTGILFKLHKANLNANMLNWIKNFLEDRTFYVAWNSKNSKIHQIKTGVPQGSCISPTLFNIYFSDIARSIPENISHALFADDLCIWFTNKSKLQI